MTSRQRICESLGHREPDRLPVDLNSTIVTSLTRVAYENLRAFLGMPPDTAIEVSHFAMDTVRAKDDLLEHYGIDTRAVGMGVPFGWREERAADGTLYDEYRIRWRKASWYWDVVEYPLADKEMKDLDGAQWPDEHDPGRYQGMRERVRQLTRAGDTCRVVDIPGLGPFEGGCFLRGHANFCADFYENPAYAEAVMDKVTDSMILFWGHILDEVGDSVEVVAQGDDVGMQENTYISPAMYRRYVKPRKKRLFDFIHSRTKAKIFYHSCGSVYDLVPDFIEEGVDILNPIQRSAAKMDIRRLKREFGKDLCFWGGGIDVQSQLPFMSVAQIEDTVKQTIDIMAPGGGFVFFPSHNIQADVSPERIDAVFRTAREYGKGS
jgi:uroporphyrinogen decarboxylase